MKLRTYSTPKPKPEPTAGLSSPKKDNRMGCLCRNKNTYSIKSRNKYYLKRVMNSNERQKKTSLH